MNINLFNRDFFFKFIQIISLEGYAIYWNSKGHLFTEQPKEKYNDLFRNGIPKKDVLPDGYEYCNL